MRFYSNYLAFSAVILLTVACEGRKQDKLAFSESVEEVVEGTTNTCRYVPTVTSIASILGVPGAPAANELIKAICAEIEAMPSLESGRDRSRPVELELPEGRISGTLLPK